MWSRANLGNLGRLGDASLAESCVPAPGEYNAERVICGGIYFDNVRSAMTWPGAAIIRDMPTVVNTLAANPMPVAFPLFGFEPGVTGPLATSKDQLQSYTLPLTPATLTSPLPSITPVKPGDISSDGVGPLCALNQLIAGSPVLVAALGAWAIYSLFKGGKR